MSDADQRTRDLEAAIDEAVSVLRGHGVAHWPGELEVSLALIRRREAAGLERLLGMYGGMGSLNDVLISPLNGHRVEAGEADEANRKLQACLSLAWTLARDLLRQAR